jgi:hypothetical protein
MCDAPGCTFTNNVAVTPGNPAIEYTNNFCIYMWRSGQMASGTPAAPTRPARIRITADSRSITSRGLAPPPPRWLLSTPSA